MLQKKWKLEPLVPGYLVLVLKLIPVIHRCSIANIERVELDFFVTQQLYAMYRIVKQTEKSYLPSEFMKSHTYHPNLYICPYPASGTFLMKKNFTGSLLVQYKQHR